MVLSREWRVCGRVQGVWFRGAARQQGQLLGVSGVARNRVDGSVQIIAEGSDVALHKLARWLHVGPKHARVDSVVDIDPPSDESLDDSFYVD